jgi:hypothetical protein
VTDSSLFLATLSRLGDERFTGTLRADGVRVGGTIVLDSGLVIAAETAAAPGLEPLLLRSGRISGEAWTETFAEAAPEGRLRAALIERGLLGSASVQVLTQTAAMDAVFALALAEVHSCLPAPAGAGVAPLVPIVPGLDIGWVVRETRRRLEVAAAWREQGLDPWVRPRRTAAEPPIDATRMEVLARVNGRRACRDIAFLLGRGLFAVMSDLRLLLQDGQIDVGPPAPAAVAVPLGPATPASPPRSPTPGRPPRPAAPGPSARSPMPVRPRGPAAPAPLRGPAVPAPPGGPVVPASPRGPVAPAPPPGREPEPPGQAGRSASAGLAMPEALAALTAGADRVAEDDLENVSEPEDAGTSQRRRLLPRWNGRGQA